MLRKLNASVIHGESSQFPLQPSGMSPGGDCSDSEPGLALEDLADAGDLGFERLALTCGEPGERLDSHRNPPAGATLVPDTSDQAIDEQDWIVASLARRCECPRGGFSPEELVAWMAANRVRVEVGQ
jgi:hypothetical protein